jgi:hypothetical protein
MTGRSEKNRDPWELVIILVIISSTLCRLGLFTECPLQSPAVKIFTGNVNLTPVELVVIQCLP